MNKMKQKYHDGKENIYKMAEEYRKLSILPEPTEAEYERILTIMELAIDDTKLDNLINQVNEQYATENNLLRDDYLDEKSSSEQKLNDSTHLTVVEKDGLDNVKYKNKDGVPKSKNTNNVILFPRSVKSHSEKKRKLFGFDIGVAIPYLAAGGLLTFFGVAQFCNFIDNKKEPSFDYVKVPIQFHESFSVQNANNSLLSNVNNTETETSVCNLDSNVANQDIKEYYESFKNLENQIITQQIQPLEIRNKVRKLQKEAEIEQRKAELNQKYAESQKEQAEIQHHYKEAQKLKDEANLLLSKSRQWLCFSRQALSLITH